MSTPCDQPQPAIGIDEDIEPRAREHHKVVCAACKSKIWWDGAEALWCENKNCAHFQRVFWNADLKSIL